MDNVSDVLLRPAISEKSTNLLAENKYTFLVNPRANRVEVKHAVESIFNVHVEKVYILKVRGKKRRQGRFVGRTPNRKKAIVALKPGDKIQVFEGL